MNTATDTLADIRARITAIRAMRALARQHGDGDKAIELSNEIYRLNELEQKIHREQERAGTPSLKRAGTP